MTSTLHWLRNTALTQWLAQYSHLLGNRDALLISGEQLGQLPDKPPVKQSIYARKNDAECLGNTLPTYVMLKSDEEWVELVLSFRQQITW
ncbi:hypothetical protein OH214_02370 [Idiomarina abyssalis]|uniref:hypothetical protein n=1 Tax=Idiomarina abyssalis TaxID=86102 RepID=UPI002301C35B|nr:hypothetical protein [Idiomarina abyssalis]MDA6065971.1 hypothetical protein [Idiomarina abyssalis]